MPNNNYPIARQHRTTTAGYVLRLLALLLLAGVFVQQARAQTIADNAAVKSLYTAIEQAKAGDTVRIADGIYRDAEMVFRGRGRANAPIVLMAMHSGKVFFEGQSNLRMSGEHLVVRGLVFRNGFTPTGEVISFRYDNDEVCNDCRVTECVVDNFNKAERSEADLWVALYGKRNRFDHNHLTGKRNQGVTMAVRLPNEGDRENAHRIDHNYFGPRPILGSNGGESLRIGTSHYSMFSSNTLVEYNYFDRCSGEVEIISSKSDDNTYRRNTFYECQGTLTMRHGNGTTVEDNYFFGNGKPNTGGIRIINKNQTVRNNYLEGLTGTRFRGALVIMNGVPNSPANRYVQVVNSKAEHNTFIDCDNVEFGTGSDAERSATPKDTRVANNIFYNSRASKIFTIHDDMSGITFADNIVSPNAELFQERGFKKEKLDFVRKDGIQVLAKAQKTGPGRTGSTDRATLENTGVPWYARSSEAAEFNTGQTTAVAADGDALFDAIRKAGAGDVLELAPGEYKVRKTLEIDKPLTIRGTGATRADVMIYFERQTLFSLENGGALSLKHVTVDGSQAPDYSGNAAIRTSRYSMTNNYKLLLEDCAFENLNVNHSFDVLRVYASTFADSIAAVDCSFKDVSGSVFAAAQETEDRGIYNVENLVVRDCTFENIGKAAIDLYRGGSDESTSGPILALSGSTFDKVGNDQRNSLAASVRIHGVQYAVISENEWRDSKPLNMHLSVGEPVIKLMGNKLSKDKDLISNSEAFEYND